MEGRESEKRENQQECSYSHSGRSSSFLVYFNSNAKPWKYFCFPMRHTHTHQCCINLFFLPIGWWAMIDYKWVFNTSIFMLNQLFFSSSTLFLFFIFDTHQKIGWPVPFQFFFDNFVWAIKLINFWKIRQTLFLFHQFSLSSSVKLKLTLLTE